MLPIFIPLHIYRYLFLLLENVIYLYYTTYVLPSNLDFIEGRSPSRYINMEVLHLAGALIEHLLELKCSAEALHIVTLTQKIYTYLLLFSFYI